MLLQQSAKVLYLVINYARSHCWPKTYMLNDISFNITLFLLHVAVIC